MKKIRLLDAASQDLLDGYRFYEKQERGLGEYFLDSLFSDIDSLVIHAGIHPVCFQTFHRLLAKRFPFAIYYRVVGAEVLVYAILDCRKSPAWARRRLRKSS
jgi:plasmid stabilization system protein ParE